MGCDRRRVLARLTHDHARSPALAQIRGRAEHRLHGATGEQLAIDQTRNLVRRPRSHSLPELVDHRSGRLGADPERNARVRGGIGQGRRDEHDRVVSETIKGSNGRDQRREMAKSAERAAEQHAHAENIGDLRPRGLKRSVDTGLAMLTESGGAPRTGPAPRRERRPGGFWQERRPRHRCELERRRSLDG